MRRQAMVLSACLAACGDNRTAPPDGASEPLPFQPAPHAPLPRVLRHSGTVLTNVKLVTLTFEGYAARDLVERFGDMIVGSSWYTTVGAEYGVQAGSQAQKLVLGPPPESLTRSEIAALIKQLITSGTVIPPAAIGNQVLYLIYIPPSVTRGPDLDRTVGYHQMLTLGSTRFPIVVVIDSSSDGRVSATPTLTAAHQLINAVTNPYQPPNDGYYVDPPKIDPWCLARGEVADLCEGETPVMIDGFALPRVYSDAAALAGRPPCKPQVPVDTWNDVTANPATMQMVRPGGSVTFEVTGWSTEDVPDWRLQTRVADFSQLTELEMRPELSDDVINNGTTVSLTLHVPLTALPGSIGGIYVLSGVNLHRWPIGFIVK